MLNGAGLMCPPKCGLARAGPESATLDASPNPRMRGVLDSAILPVDCKGGRIYCFLRDSARN